MPLGELAHRHTSVWLPKPIMEKEQRSFLFCFVFLKALGYFLLPSSFFPEQEFTTPHGFLIGEVGEKSKELTAGLPVSTQQLRSGQLLCLPSPALTGSRLMLPEIFFFFKGKEKYQTTTRTTQEEEKKKKATFEHFPAPIRLRLSYSSSEIIMKKHFRQNT